MSGEVAGTLRDKAYRGSEGHVDTWKQSMGLLLSGLSFCWLGI